MKGQNTVSSVSDIFLRQSAASQFGVASVPFHVHNGVDSNKVSFSDLKDRIAVVPYTLSGANAAVAGNYSVFLTVPFAMTVSRITEVHAAANGSALSLDIEKLTGSAAPGSGTKVTAAPFDLNAAANTVQTAALSSSVGFVQLAAGDRLALLKTGTAAGANNVTVTIILSF